MCEVIGAVETANDASGVTSFDICYYEDGKPTGRPVAHVVITRLPDGGRLWEVREENGAELRGVLSKTDKTSDNRVAILAHLACEFQE